MIKIDGSTGEGGGQILRTALGLSLLTGQDFIMEHIRAKRDKPGLLRQHLTAVNAAATISDSIVEGNQLGSKSLLFKPKAVKPGPYHFSVGTAGSASLVLQTILPALIGCPGSFEIVIEGGTHNPYAPPYDFIQKSFLPILKQMGVKCDIILEKYGFYPAGGGRLKIRVNPSDQLTAIELTDKQVKTVKAMSLISHLPYKIAQKEIDLIKQHQGLEQIEGSAFNVSSDGPGNIILIEVELDHFSAIFTGYGVRKKPLEEVVKEAVLPVIPYLSAKYVVEEYLQDQLLIPFALTGGRFTTEALSSHTLTNIDVIKKFMPVKIYSKEITPDINEITLLN